MLNKSKGNMYEFVTHTWNAIKGECYHDCSYCYMKRWGKQKPVRLDSKEFKTDLGKGNFIFVGSSCDMFTNGSDVMWTAKTLEYCSKFPENKYLFQTKNPLYFSKFCFPENSVFVTTIETNRWIPEVMNNSPKPSDRALSLSQISKDKYVTIEPIIDFDLDELTKLIKICNPIQVNIGADSGNNNLPEPSKEKILSLISELEKFTKVKKKKTLNRLLK